MTPSRFELQTGEKVLYQTHPNRKWYALAWKILVGVLEIGLISFVAAALLQEPATGFFTRFLPAPVATLVAQILFLGLVPLLILLWVTEDFASALTGDYVLTDRRIWIKGSPYAWSLGEIPLEDIGKMTSRRDAVFVHTRSDRKLHVLMISDCKLFVEAYNHFIGKEPPNRK
jgi:hypothetical protein